MSLEKAVLFAAVCDGCGPDWWEGHTDTAPMFVSKPSAIRQLRDEYEWSVTRQIDGRHLMLCGACASKHDCEKYGHEEFKASAEDPRRLDPTIRMCRRCDAVIRDDEPPAGHPDSMTRELPPEQELWLAAMAHRYWPEDDEATVLGTHEALLRLRENGGTR